VAHTICAPEVDKPIPAQPIDPPTLAMTFRVNDSPLAGTEGDKVTGRMIRDRLLREGEGNVALRVRESDENDWMEVAGRGELLTDTRGTAIMNRLFHGYTPHKGEIEGRRNGVLISNDLGEAVAYAMFKLEDRGPMMIEPGWKVYRGMIVGEHTRGNDLEINLLKGKQLTNIRTTSKDEAVRLTPPIRMTLEKALAYIQDDELVEVTPKSIRLRKKLLDANERKRAERAREAETV